MSEIMVQADNLVKIYKTKANANAIVTILNTVR